MSWYDGRYCNCFAARREGLAAQIRRQIVFRGSIFIGTLIACDYCSKVLEAFDSGEVVSNG